MGSWNGMDRDAHAFVRGTGGHPMESPISLVLWNGIANLRHFQIPYDPFLYVDGR